MAATMPHRLIFPILAVVRQLNMTMAQQTMTPLNLLRFHGFLAFLKSDFYFHQCFIHEQGKMEDSNWWVLKSNTKLVVGKKH